MALTDKLSAIGSAIRAKTGGTELLTLDAMPTAIQGIDSGGASGDLPDNILWTSSNMQYHFVYSLGKLYKLYEDKIVELAKTIPIKGDISRMFYFSELQDMNKTLEITTTADDGSSMFQSSKLKSIKVKLIGHNKCFNLSNLFYGCSVLEELAFEISDDFIYDYEYLNMNSIFSSCYKLKEIPQFWLDLNFTKNTTATRSKWKGAFSNCCNLKEIINAFPEEAKYTGNIFVDTFNNNTSLKNFTFAVQDDGTPYIRNWTKQVIDMTTVGYLPYGSSSYMDASKKITDDETYAQLKDVDGAWTALTDYRLYNHDSAVKTINSLLDTSAVGGNTIKFKGAAGAKTDGGAINTMTEEEIAVATAKGWTVSYA